MGVFERLANLIFRTATGDAKKRWLLTPAVGFVFFCFLTILILASLGMDRWLNFLSIIFLPWTLIAGLILLIPGIILWGWTMVLFARAQGTPVPVNPPQKLLTGGIYAFSRNPMMTGIYLIFFAIGLLAGSLSLTLFFTPLFIIIMTIYIMKVEEKELVMQFGQQYLDYKKKVGMYLPRLRPAK
ncbi:MAG: isoprenylcysteine carboxylmethyltransferase family protein [Dehalococcoidia bacterium]|nr:isoprenylcysteine carboxylmethyltransferase family protein [Dehalococcoidia bacterium]